MRVRAIPTHRARRRLAGAVLALCSCLAAPGCDRKPDGRAGAVNELSTLANGAAPAPTPSATPAVAQLGEPLLVQGKATGYARLPDGLVVRTSRQACPTGAPREEECRGTRKRCTKDSECKAKPNGYCANSGDGLGCGCQYGCVTDQDCRENEVCLCGDPVGSCVAVTCKDEDCRAPNRCATYHDGCSYEPFSCREQAGPRTCTF